MTNVRQEAAFVIPVTPREAALLEECFETAEEIETGFASFGMDTLEAARACYAACSNAFRAAFPAQDGENDPFAEFLTLWSDPGYPRFDADLSIDKADDADVMAAFVSGQQIDAEALASLIQKICKSALPFGFEWSRSADRMRPGEFGGGYFVITDKEILGGSTHWLMLEMLQTLRSRAGT